MDHNKTYIWIIVAVVALLAIGWYAYYAHQPMAVMQTTPTVDPKNATYSINGNNVTLVNGVAQQEAAPGSASNIVTQYFGNEVTGDFNGDGIGDAAFILTQTTGGSGTFYYVALALGSKDGTKGENAILLGDRISPQSTVFQTKEIVVNYADRKPNDPMTATPSIGVSRYFSVTNNQLVEMQK
jgi:hypothetical protein